MISPLDKAIDLIDMTAAHLAAKHPVTDVKELENQIKDEKEKQQAAADKEDYEAALNAKTKIEELQKKIDNHSESQKVTATVNDVAEAVERLTKKMNFPILLEVFVRVLMALVLDLVAALSMFKNMLNVLKKVLNKEY